MKIKTRATVLVFILIFLPVLLWGQESHIIKYKYFLLVENPDILVNNLRKYTVQHDGYVKYFSRKRVILRIPGETTVNFKKYISDKSYIIDEQVFRKDVTMKVIELKARLRVKEKLLADFYGLFNTSKFHQTLDVEREIGKVVLEIEKIKGKINYYNDITMLPEIVIHINQQSTTMNKTKTDTKWNWIRNLGVSGLLNLR